MGGEAIVGDQRPDSGRNSYPQRTNPNRPKPAGEATSPRTRGEPGPYPEKCNPRRRREPLTEEQRALATRYLPLARALARRQRGAAVDRDEFESAAYLALVEAAEAFDPARNVNFATYARHRIRGALRDQRRLGSQAGWSGDVPRPSSAGGPAPVFQRLGSGADLHGWVVGKAPTPPVGAGLETIEEVESCLRRLPRLQARACRYIYIDGKTQDEAAALMGCSKSYLSRLHREALDRLIRHCAAERAGRDRDPCGATS